MFGLVLAVLIIGGVLEPVGQVLLGNIVVGEAVGILVGQPTTQLFGTGVMAVHEIGGDVPIVSLADVAEGGVNAHNGGVGFGRRGHQDDCFRQWDTGLRQPQHIGRVNAGFHNGHRLRIGQPHILGRNDHEPPAGRHQIPRLQQPCQIVQPCVWVTASDGLLQSGQDVIVVVSVPIIAEGRLLSHQFGVLQGHRHHAVHLLASGTEQLRPVDGLAHIAAAGGGQVIPHIIRCLDGHAVALLQQPEGTVYRRSNLLGRDRFELKDGGAGEDGIENGEVGVLRGGSDDGDLAVLHELQQGLLLLFIEILDLIQVEQHPVGRQQGVNISDDLPNVRNGGGGGVEPVSDWR